MKIENYFLYISIKSEKFKMLYCRRLCNTAKTPVSVNGNPGCYSLFLAFPLTVDPGCTASVDVGLLFKLTHGFYPIVVSDRTSMAHELLVNSFNTLVDTALPDGSNADVAKLEFTVCNNGKVPVSLAAGANIARMLLVQTHTVNIHEVEQFPENEPTFKRENQDTNVPVTEIPKTEAIWFKRMFKDKYDECFKRFFDSIDGRSFLTKIEEMRKTTAFQTNTNKAMYEARWVWDNLPEKIKKTVVEQFREHKRSVLVSATR